MTVSRRYRAWRGSLRRPGLPLRFLSCAAVAVTALAVLPAHARVDALAATNSATEAENVRAFARLFGVVRFFYPGDASDEINWGRFAIHGVAQVRPATDARALAAALQSLVAPLGPGIVIAPDLPEMSAATDRSPLVAWRYLGPGFADALAYRAQRTNRPGTAKIEGFTTVMRSVPAAALRGRLIRLRGHARVNATGDSGKGALWMRVDRPQAAVGFFDNMLDRPIREPTWREYTIQGSVADDAVNVAIGVMALGAATADFDAIELSSGDSNGNWTAVALTDDGFEAAAGDSATGWLRGGNSSNAVVQRISVDPFQGHQCLRLAPGVAADGAPFDAPSVAGDHVDFDLGSGLRARVPLALSDDQARIGASQRASLDALKTALAESPADSGDPGLHLRLADVVVAWNVFRHFYPYWNEAGVDWDARLPALLDAAARATTRQSHAEALRALIADVRDGHGTLTGAADLEPQGQIPLRFAFVGDQLVVTASATPVVPVGAVLLQIDGVPVAKTIEKLLASWSGTLQWRRALAARGAGNGPPDRDARLRIDDGREVRDVVVRRSSTEPPAERRPHQVTELEPGIFYVDMTRATHQQFETILSRLASARGVVFDMRGYPNGDVGAQVLRHLIDAPEADRWMHIARIIGPFGRSAGWDDIGWNLQPAAPRVAGRRIFLTDSRAISYAESVMGYVADRRLATIVGGTTAGTNGNVATFDLPSGLQVRFTGMRVTGHDGHTPHHLVGVRPDVPVAPTLAGLRAGRDEVLERGLALIRATPPPQAGVATQVPTAPRPPPAPPVSN